MAEYPEFISLGHAGAVRSVAYSPDGSRAISGSADSSLRLWDLTAEECMRVFEGHSGWVNSVAFSPDGYFAISGSDDKSLRLWDLVTGECVRTFEGHSKVVVSVAFSPDGSRAISGSDDTYLLLWDVKTGECICQLKGHTKMVNSVIFSPDGTRAMSASSDATLRLWDLESGDCLQVFGGHSSAVTSVAIFPDATRALSASSDTTLRLWDLENGKCLGIFGGHWKWVNCVAISSDGSHAISGSDDTSLRLWDLAKGDCIRVLEGHSDAVSSIAFSPDGTRVISGSVDFSLRLWDLNTGICLNVIEGHAGQTYCVSFSTDGSHAVSGSNDNSLRLWNLSAGKCFRAFQGHSDGVRTVSLSPNASRIISGSYDASVRLWDFETGDCLGTFRGHQGPIYSVAFSPDGSRAISGSKDLSLRLWDLLTGQCSHVLVGHAGPIYCVAFSLDGSSAISGSNDGSLRLWDVATGECFREFKGHFGPINCVALSPDGRQFISGSDDASLRLWDFATGECIGVYEGHSGWVQCVAFTRDGSRALSGSNDGTICLWDLATGAYEAYDKGYNDVRSLFVGTDEVLIALGLGYIRRARLTGGKKRAAKLYTNAKVLFVGDSGAGKTGLSSRLARGEFEPSHASTVGVWSTHLPLPSLAAEDGVEKEIWLWDFAGQSDQRLIHQLYTDRCGAILLLFNADQDDPIPTLREWNDALERSAAHAPLRILVAARTDTGFRAPKNRLKEFADHHGMQYIETSALSGLGCDELIEKLKNEIPWDKIEIRSSPPIFKRIRDEIVKLRDEGEVLLTFDRLQHLLEKRLGEDAEVEKNLRAVAGLLDGPGVVKELDFGNYVLLRPEWISRYPQAVIRTLRADDLQLGSLEADRIRSGELVFSITYEDKVREEERLPEEQEKVVLRAMEEALVAKCLCLRMDDKLVFPSHCGRERPSLPTYPNVSVSYRFGGYLDDVYATLVTRIFYSRAFKLKQIWRDAADFETLDGEHCIGVRLNREDDGSGTIQLYRDKEVTPDVEVIFANFIHEHLKRTAKDVARQRHYVCPQCGEPYLNLEVARERLAHDGKDAKAMCARCEERFPLWDRLEQLFPDPEIHKKILLLEEATRINVDMRRQAEILVGEVHAIIAEANQKFNEIPGNNDEGIDVELEFTDAKNVTTGVKAHLQLKCGNSHLKMRSDESERFVIDNLSWLTVWSRQPGPVFLVIGTLPDERDRERRRFREIRYMELTKERLSELQQEVEARRIQLFEKWEDSRRKGHKDTPEKAPEPKSISIDFEGHTFNRRTVLEWRRQYAKDFLKD